MKKNVWIPIAMFVVMIFGGMLWSMLTPEQSYSDTENRFLASKPTFSLESLFDRKDSYTQKYETYITDQFPVRDKWIGFKTQVEKLLGKVETKDVFLGKDDYLIVNHPASDFEGEQAVKNVEFLAEGLVKYARELGLGHVRMLLVPTASQILTDKLPAHAMPYDQSLYVEQVRQLVKEKLAEELEAMSGTWLEDSLVMDAESILKDHQNEYIYYRTDHHWTTQGAFYVYQQWANTLGLTPLADPGLKVVSEAFEGTTYSKLHTAGQQDVISVYEPQTQVTLLHNQMNETTGFYDWSKLDVRDKYALFLGGNDALLDITREGVTEPENVLLVVKDSFANCFIPYAAEHYDRVVVVDLRYLNMPISRVVEEYGVTDLLVLYNVQAAATDKDIYKITR